MDVGCSAIEQGGLDSAGEYREGLGRVVEGHGGKLDFQGWEGLCLGVIGYGELDEWLFVSCWIDPAEELGTGGVSCKTPYINTCSPLNQYNIAPKRAREEIDLRGSLRYKLNARALINLFCLSCASTCGYVDFPCVTAVSKLSWPKPRIPWVLGPNAVVRSCAACSTMSICMPSIDMPPNANVSCMLVPKYAALSP